MLRPLSERESLQGCCVGARALDPARLRRRARHAGCVFGVQAGTALKRQLN
jgi:hypothetical protein